MFTGLSAFPLTPLQDDTVDYKSFTGLIQRLDSSDVDSITVLGSTGSYAYLTPAERARVATVAVETAHEKPILVGVGALRTSHVLANIRSAEEAGAAGILLAPMSYLPLTEDDVFELFRTVSDHTELPVLAYDNPATTHFTFSKELYGRIAHLPGVASIKIPGVPADPIEARAHIDSIRAFIPAHVTIGVSGDAFGAAGLIAGCDAWYSVIAGTIPTPALRILRAVRNGDAAGATTESERLAPLWKLFAECGGSIRVVAAIAECLQLAPHRSLPLPLQGLTAVQRERVAEVVKELGLDR